MGRPTPSYVSGASEAPLLGLTIGDLFDQCAERWPDREALVVRHQGARLTYRELKEAADRAARGLLRLGLGAGDRVCIWSQNNAEWVVTQLATAKIGAILVNINPAYRLHELEYVLAQSGCRALVASPGFKASDYTAMLQEHRTPADALRQAQLALQRERRWREPYYWAAFVLQGEPN